MGKESKKKKKGTYRKTNKASSTGTGKENSFVEWEVDLWVIISMALYFEL